MDSLKTDVDTFADVHGRYLLVTQIPVYEDASGVLWLEQGWHHDFLAHLAYVKDLVNCAPRHPRGAEENLVRLDVPAGAKLSFVHLPPQSSYLGALLHLPRTFLSLWRAVAAADIVHSGIGGWPYPLGWIVHPLALLRRKRLLINVESDWKLSAPGRDGWKRRLVHMDPIRDAAARWSCERADLALFTHVNYRDQLVKKNRERAHVTPAVWVNDADILDVASAEAGWEAKLREPVRLLFAGRLVAAKGVQVLLAALRSLEERRLEARVDIIGQGEERSACVAAAAALRSVRLSVLDPIPYGAAFFELLRRYHAVLVPSLTDEQPRIVFDANSQAVPVIASRTGGLEPYVEHGRTGWIVPVGDAAALGSAIERATGAAPELRSMGLAALQASRGFTHQAMHRWRSHLIVRFCSPGR